MRKQDVAIVGGGIVGLLVAREILARAPGARVVMIDRDLAGSGASRRSAGLSVPFGATERLRAMAAYSREYYEKLKRERPSLPIYPLGLSLVAARAARLEVRTAFLPSAGLTRAGDRGGGTGGESAPVIAGEAIRVPPDAEILTGGGGQYADVYALSQALAADLRTIMSLREGVAVTAIEPTSEGLSLHLGTGDTLVADRVVLAPGPWLRADAWRSLVAPLDLSVKKIVSLHIEWAPEDSDRVVLFREEDHAYLLPVRHRGHWLLSYTCPEWGVEPDSLTAGLTASELAGGREILHRYAPELAGRCSGGRVFCDAYSPAREPVVRALDEDARIVFAGAANGSGYRLAPAIAAAAADALHLGQNTRRND